MYINALLKNRKIIISNLICETVIFFFIFNIFDNFQKIIILIFFFFISYILGKYDLIFPIDRKLFQVYALKYSVLFFMNFIFYYFTYSLVNLKINYQFFLILFSKFLILNLLSQLVINKTFFRSNQNSKIWLAFINDDEKKELDNYVKRQNNTCRQKINLFHFKNIKKHDVKKFEGLIVDLDLIKKNKDYEKYINKNKKLIFFSTLDWCNYYLEFLPVSLLNKYCHKIQFLQKNKSKYYFLFKKFGDIFISTLLIIVTSPLMFLVCILIKIEDGGPILYSQKRTGLNLKIFKIYKFRSMKVDAEDFGIQWSTRRDPRITKVGKFIRLTRIDELPQLISVIKGEMSLIGPRPERPEINESLFKETEFFKYRYLIKPGLSGWAQVNYNYAASKEESIKKLGYDMYYLKNCSFLLDILIIFKTMKLILNLKGALPN